MGATGKDIWKLGEDIYTPNSDGDALRYMYDPARGRDYDWYPSRFTGSADNGGVHSNSGIANLAFYLLVMGGEHPHSKSPDVTVTGIGFEEAAKIFYHANADCLTQSATFESARYCTADALDGKHSANVHAAWDAVGVPRYQPYVYKVLLHTDDYPQETTWTITDDCKDNELVAAGGPYSSRGADESTLILEEGKYTLTVNDSYGDGLCCSYGNGAFSVSHQNGTLLTASVDTFTFAASASFGSNSCSTPFPSTMPSSLPSSLPSSRPSSAPSTTGTPSTSPSVSPKPSSKPSDQPSKLPSSRPIWTEIFANGFESGFGNFNDGGKDAKLNSGTRNSHTGSKSLRLRDNTGTSLSFTDRFPVSSYSTLKVEFWYKSSGFDVNDDSFSLQSANVDGGTGTGWVTKGTWTRGSNIFTSNGTWYFASVEFAIDADTSTMRIQFMSNSDVDREKVFIDDVTVSGGN
jgi:hypothetical protein